MMDGPRLRTGAAVVVVGALIVAGFSTLLYGEWVSAQPDPWAEVVGSVNVQGWGSFGNVVYDPVNRQVYVDSARPGSWYPGQNVTILNPATGRIVGSVPAGPEPAAMTVDTRNGNVLVADSSSAYGGWAERFNITELSGSNNTPLWSTPLDFIPSALAFDPVNGLVYVGGYGNPSFANLTVLDPATGEIVAETRGEASAVAVDPARGLVLFANTTRGPPTVMVMDGNTQRLVKNVTTGTEPWGYASPSMAYDPQTGEIFESGVSLSNVRRASFSVFNATSGFVAASDVPLPGEDGIGASIVYDGQNGRLYALGWECGGGSSGSGCVIAIDGRTHAILGTVPVGSEPNSIAFDPQNGDLYLSDSGGARVWFVSTQAAAPPPLTSLPNASGLLLGLALGVVLVAVGAREMWAGRQGGEHRVPEWVRAAERAEERASRTLFEKPSTWFLMTLTVLGAILLLALLAG
ncbi:MAG: YncE family protein [Euryarchaeota archaeon]|nr:YncE family protein [Euryarchaeota archaeon]